MSVGLVNVSDVYGLISCTFGGSKSLQRISLNLFQILYISWTFFSFLFLGVYLMAYSVPGGWTEVIFRDVQVWLDLFPLLALYPGTAVTHNATMTHEVWSGSRMGHTVYTYVSGEFLVWIGHFRSAEWTQGFPILTLCDFSVLVMIIKTECTGRNLFILEKKPCGMQQLWCRCNILQIDA